MQLTYDQAMRPGSLLAFAARRGSGYMMRSQKREDPYGNSPNNRRPPKRKPAGFVYIFLMLLISILIWPIGMVMLWRRKVRLQAGTKLLISLLTLCLSVFLIVFALTVPVDNPRFTAFQDRANDWLDKAASDAAVAGDAAIRKAGDTWHVMSDFAEANRGYMLITSADSIDKGVELAGQARTAIEGLFKRAPKEPESTEAPGVAATPVNTDTPADTDNPTDTDAPADTDNPTDTDAPADTDNPTDTDAPADTDTPADTDNPKGADASADGKYAFDTQAPTDSDAPKSSEAPLVTDALADNIFPTDSDAPSDTEIPAESKASHKPVTSDAQSAAPDAGTPDNESAVDIHLPAATPDPQSAQALTEGTLHSDGTFEAGALNIEPADASKNAPSGETEATAESSGDTGDAAEPPAEAGGNTADAVETSAEAGGDAVNEAPSEAIGAAEDEISPEAGDSAEDKASSETGGSAEDETASKSGGSTEPSDGAPAEVEPEASPQPVGKDYTVKPAGEATVYFFDTGSKGFHRTPNSHDMSGAPAHTLAEAFAAGKKSCNSCGMPDQSILSVENIAWVDDQNRFHTTDECPSFSGQWKLISLADAVSLKYLPCPDCGADAYAEAIYPAPTPTPEPQIVTPATPLKSAGEATVYYHDTGKGYHASANCVGMSNAPAHTLSEALAAGKHACGHCFPISADLIGLPMLWLDEAGICHTSDACGSFKGKYTLIRRDDALARGLPACPDCGASEYLVPGTVLAGG